MAPKALKVWVTPHLKLSVFARTLLALQRRVCGVLGHYAYGIEPAPENFLILRPLRFRGLCSRSAKIVRISSPIALIHHLGRDVLDEQYI
jgi:hypothetical protein